MKRIKVPNGQIQLQNKFLRNKFSQLFTTKNNFSRVVFAKANSAKISFANNVFTMNNNFSYLFSLLLIAVQPFFNKKCQNITNKIKTLITARQVKKNITIQVRQVKILFWALGKYYGLFINAFNTDKNDLLKKILHC